MPPYKYTSDQQQKRAAEVDALLKRRLRIDERLVILLDKQRNYGKAKAARSGK